MWYCVDFNWYWFNQNIHYIGVTVPTDSQYKFIGLCLISHQWCKWPYIKLPEIPGFYCLANLPWLPEIRLSICKLPEFQQLPENLHHWPHACFYNTRVHFFLLLFGHIIFKWPEWYIYISDIIGIWIPWARLHTSLYTSSRSRHHFCSHSKCMLHKIIQMPLCRHSSHRWHNLTVYSQTCTKLVTNAATAWW